MVDPARFIVDFDAVDHDDRHHVGEHAAHLGKLHKSNIKLPQGFIITPAAYFSFLTSSGLDSKIAHLIGSIDFNDKKSVEKVAKHIKSVVNSSKVPDDLVSQIFTKYWDMGVKDVKIHTSIVTGDQAQN